MKIKLLKIKDVQPQYSFSGWNSSIKRGYVFYRELLVSPYYEVIFRFKDWLICKEFKNI